MISLSEPHTFQSVSHDLCALFDLAPEQMRGRSIKMLQGPRTNAAALSAAIKAARLQQRSTVPVTAYRRDGSECVVVVSCSARVGEDGEVDGLSLDFVPLSGCSSSPSCRGRLLRSSSAAAHRPVHRLFAPDRPGKEAPPAPFGSAGQSGRDGARGAHNRAVGRELAALEAGRGGWEDDAELLEELLTGVEAE